MLVTTTYLEQTDPQELKFSKAPGKPVRIERVLEMTPAYGRYLYSAVGETRRWTGRLSWTEQQWRDCYELPGSETWVAYVEGGPAGYVELATSPGDGGTFVEIAFFGLTPAFTGQGIGGHLLSVGIHKAWSLRRRWPEFPPVKKIWVQTSSLDGPTALQNYQARGFSIYQTAQAEQEAPATIVWPGTLES